MRKFQIITGHGKIDFIEKDGKIEFLSVNDKPLSKALKMGKLGKEEKQNCQR